VNQPNFCFKGPRAGFTVQVLAYFGFASTASGLSPSTPGAFALHTSNTFSIQLFVVFTAPQTLQVYRKNIQLFKKTAAVKVKIGLISSLRIIAN
jgi:hypothetical protein